MPPQTTAQPVNQQPSLPANQVSPTISLQSLNAGLQNAVATSNNTPSPLQSIPQSMTTADLISSHNLLNPTPSASGNPSANSFPFSTLVSNLPAAQSLDHPGYTGTVTSATHVADASGGMPQGYSPTTSYNNFIAGQCTSYASWYWTNVLGKKFVDINGQGNAKNWPELAKEQGYSTSSTPQVNDIVSWPDMGPYGHVAIVTGVNPNGTIDVSEMNYVPNKYTTRSNVSTSGAVFIH